MPDPFLEVYQTYTKNMAKNPKMLFVWKQIKLQVGGKAIVVTLKCIIMCQPGIIGQNTCFVKGMSDEWPDMDLVVKISWPVCFQVPKNMFAVLS